MKHSTDRILTTHAGALPQPNDLRELHMAKDSGQPFDQKALAQRVRTAVAEVVKKQIDCGLDIINDGEAGKSNFSRYARERLSGFIERDAKPSDQVSSIFARDMVEFGDYFRKRMGGIHLPRAIGGRDEHGQPRQRVDSSRAENGRWMLFCDRWSRRSQTRRWRVCSTLPLSTGRVWRRTSRDFFKERGGT